GRRVLLVGAGLFAAGSLIAAAAPSHAVLIVGQAVLGAGAAALAPSSLALLTQAYSEGRPRARAIAIWASTSAAAVALGPVGGGLLIAPFGWRSVFLLDLPFALAIGWLAFRHIPEPPRHRPHALDLGGQLSAIVSLAALTFALIEGRSLGWGSPWIVGALLVAAGAGVAFVAIEREAREPMLPLDLFGARSFGLGSLIGMLFSFSVYGLLFVLSLYLQDERGLCALQTGLLFLAQPASFAAATFVATRVTRWRRMGTSAAMAFGTVVVVAGAL